MDDNTTFVIIAVALVLGWILVELTKASVRLAELKAAEVADDNEE